jgi:hypothetical protein
MNSRYTLRAGVGVLGVLLGVGCTGANPLWTPPDAAAPVDASILRNTTF